MSSPVSRRGLLGLSVVGVAAAVTVVGAASVGSRRGPDPAPALDEGLPPGAAVDPASAPAPSVADPVAPVVDGHPSPAPVRLPGAGTRWESMATRALADLRALDGPFPLVPDTRDHRTVSAGVPGAAIAAWRPAWRLVWPRDASFVVAALSLSGEDGRAGAVLDFLARVAPGDGRWQARYLPDGSGHAPDDRGVQADEAGWVCWAVWCHTGARPRGPDPARWWPVVRVSADRMAASLDASGQPVPSPDYWEVRTDRVTLETMTALLVGLRAAAAVATHLGRRQEATRWTGAARRVAGALRERWAPVGYPRTVPTGGADAAVGLLAALAPDLPHLAGAVADASRVLTLPDGGIRPGELWPHHDGIAWTPEVAMIALGSTRTDPPAARVLLDWLDRHRTASGAIPEKVAPDGAPSSVAPLGWSGALVLLVLAAMSSAPVVPPT